MTDDALREALRVAAAALKSAAVWSDKKLASIEGNFLYETYVLSRMLVDLRAAGWNVVLAPGHSGNAYSLPMAPAEKSQGWATFKVSRRGRTEVWEICAGTAVRDIDNRPRHPDISVQRPVDVERPSYDDLTGMFDAKYRRNAGAITSHEFADFARWIDLLRQTKKSPPWGDVPPFAAHALITNGGPSPEVPAELVRRGVREVHAFAPGLREEIRP